MTGSGRCNITNAAAAAPVYSCGDPDWIETLLNHFGVPELLAALNEISILVHPTSDGWYYPLSQSAHTVVDAFSNSLDLAGVNLCCTAQVRSIHAKGKGFVVRYSHNDKEEEEEFERVIVSAGGKAYPSLGSRGELFPVLEGLGHTVLPVLPALAPLLVDLDGWLPLEGIRLDVGVTMWDGSQRLAAAAGNLIFTKWGLNGPAVMDISHHVSAHAGDNLTISIDLLAFFQDEFERLLADKRPSRMPLRIFLGAFFPPKVSITLLRNNNLTDNIRMQQVSNPALSTLVKHMQDIRLQVKGVRGFEYCQVSTGGVPVNEVNPHTMESLRVNGLYLTGETLDVVGPCGGYNLQFAFSSGAVAGQSAAGGLRK